MEPSNRRIFLAYFPEKGYTGPAVWTLSIVQVGISPVQVQRNCSSFALPYFVFGVSRYVLLVWQILLCLLRNISFLTVVSAALFCLGYGWKKNKDKSDSP